MFCRELYLDEYTAGNLKTIRRKIRQGKYMPGIYVLMLSKKDGTLEYMNSAYLAQKYYKKNPPFIIGLAKSQESMLHMIQGIFEEVLQVRGDVDVRAYLKEKTSGEEYKKLRMFRFTIFDQDGDN